MEQNTTKKSRKKPFKAIIAWCSASSDCAQERGIKTAQRLAKKNSWTVTTKSFETEEQRKYYLKGVSDGAGWDEPSTHIVEKKKEN